MIYRELNKLKKDFLGDFGDLITENKMDEALLDLFHPRIDKLQKNLGAKISLVGFSGVGKTTITKLIREQEIPMVHEPTITGKMAIIKIGKLHFSLWDFAGQEQFSYIWNNFIESSDAVLIITDSTLENVEKSKYFLELIKSEVPYAKAAVIGNKQDLPEAMDIEEIENHLHLKTYSMIAIDPENRSKMIQIISDVLELNKEISPLLKPLFERDQLIEEAQHALEKGNFAKSLEKFEKIVDVCLELGDDNLSREFNKRAEKIRNVLNK